MNRIVICALLFVAACKKQAKLQVVDPGGAQQYATDKSPESVATFGVGETFEAKVPKDGTLPERVFATDKQTWVETKGVVIVPASGTARHVTARNMGLRKLDGQSEPVAFGSVVRLVRADAKEPYAVLDAEGMLQGFLEGTIALSEVAPTPAQWVNEARSIIANNEGDDKAKALLAKASDVAAKALLAGIERLAKLDDAPARKGARSARIAGDSALAPVAEKHLAYVRVPSLELKVKDEPIKLAFGDAVIVERLQGEVARVALDPGANVDLEGGSVALGKTVATVSLGTGALDGMPQDSETLITMATRLAQAGDFERAFMAASRRLYMREPLSGDERLSVARMAVAAGKLDAVFSDLGIAAAAEEKSDSEERNEGGAEREETSDRLVGVSLMYGCRGKRADSEQIDRAGVAYDEYEWKSMPKNACLVGVDARKPPAPEDPETMDHFEDSYPSKADQRRAKKEYERELAAYERNVTPKWDRWVETLAKMFGGPAYFVVTVTPKDLGERRLFAYYDRISASCDPRSGCSFTLMGEHAVIPLPTLRGEQPVSLWLPYPKARYFEHEHGVIAADSAATVERWLTLRSSKFGSALDMPKFGEPPGFKIERWSELGPME